MYQTVYQQVLQWIPEQSRVLDLGTGDGEFLEQLVKAKRVTGEGVELNPDHVTRCIERGLAVHQGDVMDGLDQYGDGAFDYVVKPLRMLVEVGLGYLRLGQSATTLSGGEAQRLKLAAELCRSNRNGRGTLYLLDEPTTGLHLQDIQALWNVLQSLADAGNTVVLVEHHPDMVRLADWVIDLGPEGGDKGGQVLFQGPVSEFLRLKGPNATRDAIL